MRSNPLAASDSRFAWVSREWCVLSAMATPTRITLLLLTTSLASAQGPFFDGFEGAALDPFWTASATSGSIVFPETTVVRSGVQAVRFTSTNTGVDKLVELRHPFTTPTYGTISVWVNDTGATATFSNYFGLRATSINQGMAIYTFDYNLTPTNGGSYVFTVPGRPTATHSTVARTAGWHLFTIRSTPTTLTYLIDGSPIYNGPGGFPFATAFIWMNAPSYRPAFTTYFDDFSFFPYGSGVGQINSPCASLTVNGNGGTANGPFVVAAPAGGSLNLAWSGPANQPIALVASPNFTVGQNWFGNVIVDLDMASSVVLFDGLGPLSRLLFSTNASAAPFGTTSQSIPIPPAAAGGTLRVQGVVFDFAGVCPNPGLMTTAAFEVRL
ncbi:MAG: hypothetical protein IPK26_14080 [Planctomycetes bacterium]|nr:hypothetical protein [Planctomycetota bacterium]